MNEIDVAASPIEAAILYLEVMIILEVIYPLGSRMLCRYQSWL